MPQLKHLGGWLSPINSNAPERNERIQAMSTAWMRYYGCWFSEHLPKRIKRLLFCSVVQNAGISGMESYALLAGDYGALDRGVAKKLRAMSLGDACKNTTEGHKAWSTMAVFRHWRVCPVVIELTVR